jgi:formylglycine-generating enzyme required for sulfatase activity
MNRILPLALFAVALPGAAADMADIPAGRYIPFFARAADKPITIAPFRLDKSPVTNREFLAFVESHPQWRKSAIAQIFAEKAYLAHWRGDLALPENTEHQPVTNVSWFAANAYCTALGKTLPSTNQWEFALQDGGRDADALRKTILDWYAVPNGAMLTSVEALQPNGFGVAGLAGIVWEWTSDYSAAMAGSELRNSGDKNAAVFCGGGSLGAKDASDYAAFMRYSFRASLKAAYVTGNLGFRCAAEAGS